MQRFKFGDKVSEDEGVNIRDPIILIHRKQTTNLWLADILRNGGGWWDAEFSLFGPSGQLSRRIPFYFNAQ